MIPKTKPVVNNEGFVHFPRSQLKATLNPSWNPGVHFHDTEKEKSSLKKILYWEKYRDI